MPPSTAGETPDRYRAAYSEMLNRFGSRQLSQVVLPTFPELSKLI
jgi:hypothetical protein